MQSVTQREKERIQIQFLSIIVFFLDHKQSSYITTSYFIEQVFRSRRTTNVTTYTPVWEYQTKRPISKLYRILFKISFIDCVRLNKILNEHVDRRVRYDNKSYGLRNFLFSIIYDPNDPELKESLTFLTIPTEERIKLQAQPFDGKKQCWAPDAKESFVAAEVTGGKGEEVIVKTAKGDVCKTKSSINSQKHDAYVRNKIILEFNIEKR